MGTLQPASQRSELKNIVDPDDPAWSGGKTVVGVFVRALEEQYKDMIYSVHYARQAAKGRKRLPSGDPVPYPSIFPRALKVWNLTIAEAQQQGISINRESWDWLNSDQVHIQACDQCTNPVLPLDLDIEIPPKLPWLPMDITKEFRKCHRLFVEDDPALAILANGVVRDALCQCPMASVSFWPSSAVSAYIDTLGSPAMWESPSPDTDSAATSPAPAPDHVLRYLKEDLLCFEAPSFESLSFDATISNAYISPPSVMTDMSGALFNLGSLHEY